MQLIFYPYTRVFLASLALMQLSACSTPKISDQADAEAFILNRGPSKIVRKSGPDLLNFKELIQLAENPKPEGKLGEKLDRLLRTPFINNEVYFSKGMPALQTHPKLGPSLRVSTWNIEKSVRIKEAGDALTSSSKFRQMLRPEFVETAVALTDAERQRADLAASDILLLQEMDIGHCRSGYVFAADHLARKLDMNYVYAPQQLEIDPVHLGLDHIKFDNGHVDKNACRALVGAAPIYRGVFGVAVLSKFPIKRAQIFQLKNQPYDWYAGEIHKPDFLEQGRRIGSNALFKFQPIREVKAGGRAFTLVDLHVPGLPQDTLSVVNVHLEIKTTPKGREKQMQEILTYIRGIQNPVIMAGDYNSASRDVSATSFLRHTKRTVTDPTTLLAAGLFAADVTGAGQAQKVLNGYKNYRNPLAADIPVILPNRVKGLFKSIEKFRFADGGAFDFRGDRERSARGIGGKLSNSNQRHPRKGFTFTFSVPRPIGPIGKERLDWIFVKSFLKKPTDSNGPYRLAPHYGETLNLMNLALSKPISDHHPITAVLPLKEPKIRSVEPEVALR